MLQTYIKHCRLTEIKSNTMTKVISNNFFKWSLSLRPILPLTRFSSETTSPMKITDGEKRIKDILERAFPNAASIKVQDVSGGCGSMYTVGVQTNEFKGLPIIKQHRLVHEALKQEIKDMHGIQINTASP